MTITSRFEHLSDSEFTELFEAVDAERIRRENKIDPLPKGKIDIDGLIEMAENIKRAQLDDPYMDDMDHDSVFEQLMTTIYGGDYFDRLHKAQLITNPELDR